MKHQHHPLATEQAHALLSCRGLELAFCACGAFQLNGCERWVRPGPPPVELTAREVARQLHCHLSTIYLHTRELHGWRVRGPYRREWRFNQKSIDRFRELRPRVPRSWRD
jgi:hypothetical protein